MIDFMVTSNGFFSMEEIKRKKHSGNLFNEEAREKTFSDKKKHGTLAHQYIQRDGRVLQPDEHYEGTWV
jgi:hypothetical protein